MKSSMLTIALLFLPVLAIADIGGIFVEPGLNYEQGILKVTNPTTLSGEQDEKITGLGVGVRLGFHFFDILYLAGDARYSKPRYQSDALNGSADASALNFGATLGVQTPVAGLRLWATSVIDGQLDPDAINATNIKYTGFNGYRIGVGFYVAMVSLDLEYQEAKYKSVDVESLGPFTANAISNMNGTQKAYILGVSFPIAL